MQQYTNSLMEMVTTFDNTLAQRKDCRFIKGNYYIKNKQCFLIDGVWYRINSGYIVYEYRSKTWILESTPNLTNGIVGFNSDYSPIFGHFIQSGRDNPTLYHNGIFYSLLDDNIISNIPNIKEGMNGSYYFSNQKNIPKELIHKVNPSNRDTCYSFPYNYGSDALIPEFLEVFTNNFKGENLISDAFKHLDGYTFGVEFETCKGTIPEKYLKKSGLIACRDGSITGFEYVTVPLYGSTGIQAIKNACNLLNKFCACSVNESMHIHVGGFSRTKRNIAALYRLSLMLERNLYAMFPYYYADTSKFKRKSYCGPLPRLALSAENPTDIYGDFFTWLTGGMRPGKSFPTMPHPLDRSGQHKWEISPRYVHTNIIPLIWGNRGTVEFRCHIPTMQYQKVINWLFIVVAILKYAKKHAILLTSKPYDKLPKLSLYDVISDTYPLQISTILCKYIEDRVTYYSNKNDEIGEMEIMEEELGRDVFNLIPFV